MAKTDKTVFEVFFKGAKLYFKNFDKFAKYMAFPVFGQVVGIFLIFGTLYLYLTNIQIKIEYPASLYLPFIVTIPGFIIFLKAFWEYLVAYGSVNSMVENMTKSGKLYDIDAHTELIQRRSPSFIGLWMLLGLFSLTAINPLFTPLACIVFVYFILIFQVFVFEPEISPIGCFKRSIEIIKHNFARTLGLLAIVGGLTYLLLPAIVELKTFSVIINHTAAFIEPFVKLLPINSINTTLEYHRLPTIMTIDVARLIIKAGVSGCIIAFTLPLRSICWALWYKALNKNQTTSKVSTKKKKYKTKQLDPEIIARAMRDE